MGPRLPCSSSQGAPRPELPGFSIRLAWEASSYRPPQGLRTEEPTLGLRITRAGPDLVVGPQSAPFSSSVAGTVEIYFLLHFLPFYKI